MVRPVRAGRETGVPGPTSPGAARRAEAGEGAGAAMLSPPPRERAQVPPPTSREAGGDVAPGVVSDAPGSVLRAPIPMASFLAGRPRELPRAGGPGPIRKRWRGRSACGC
ncbi:hypothetical protein GCM10009525_76940 [Streptosporangium amethystogenes subsp. fukuiense]